MLELNGITKSYGVKRVLDDVSFRVASGRLTGFVGGNGAGKTTTMRIVLGVLGRDSGEVTLDGAPVTAADRRLFGYMPEERGLYPKMRVLEHIVYLARLHGFDKAEATARAEALLVELGLGERLRDNVETLSLGNQQRAQIAAARRAVLGSRSARRRCRRGRPAGAGGPGRGRPVLVAPARRRRTALRRPRHHRGRHDPRRRHSRRPPRRARPAPLRADLRRRSRLAP